MVPDRQAFVFGKQMKNKKLFDTVSKAGVCGQLSSRAGSDEAIRLVSFSNTMAASELAQNYPSTRDPRR